MTDVAAMRPLVALCGPGAERRFVFEGAFLSAGATHADGRPADPPPLVHAYRLEANGRRLCVSIDQRTPYLRCWDPDTGRELPQAVAVARLIG